MTDRERWQLRGAVRSCRLERRRYSRRCGADTCDVEERGDATTVDFRFNGNLSSQVQQNPDGSEWTSAYQYDTSGRKSKTLHVDVAAQRSDMHYLWGVEGTDSGYSAPGAANLTTTYNHRDQPPAQFSFRDLAGRELSRVDFQYDESGRLVEEAQTNSEEVLPPEYQSSVSEVSLRISGRGAILYFFDMAFSSSFTKSGQDFFRALVLFPSGHHCTLPRPITKFPNRLLPLRTCTFRELAEPRFVSSTDEA